HAERQQVVDAGIIDAGHAFRPGRDHGGAEFVGYGDREVLRHGRKGQGGKQGESGEGAKRHWHSPGGQCVVARLRSSRTTKSGTPISAVSRPAGIWIGAKAARPMRSASTTSNAPMQAVRMRCMAMPAGASRRAAWGAM